MIEYLAENDFRLRSFVRRDSRMTAAQQQAYETQWSRFGLSLHNGFFEAKTAFGREAPCQLEIGFGSGRSLLQLAKLNPETNFIGIETHKPGVGALLLAMSQENISNIRLYHADAIDVLTNCIPDGALQGSQIFFPDPWPKRKHLLRRLVQLPLIELLFSKIMLNGFLHLATDWEDYAIHMLSVMTQSSFQNHITDGGYAPTRSEYRPLITKLSNER